MKMQCNKVLELIQNGVLEPPMDGNHGEKHPKTDDYVSIGVPFILVPDLKDGIVDLDNCNFISEEQAKNLKKGFSKTGDVLFTHKATIGKVALVDTKQYNYIILTPQVTYYRVKNDNILSNKYLYYYFLSPTFQKIFRAFASSGGTRDYLGIEAQRKLPIFYPEIHIQERIADILSQYDNLIHNNNKRIKILEKMAENLYKEWFVRFRFPNYQNTEFENGIPKGWKVVRLGEYANISTGKCNREDAEEAGIYPLFDRSQEIKKSNSWIKDCEAIIVPGEGTSFIPRYYVGKFNLHQRCYCIEPKNKNTGKYIFYSLMLNRIYFLYVATGATVPSLRQNNFTSMKIIMPKMSLVKRFDEIISLLFEQINFLEKANEKLSKQRDVLLPRLMSGKLEV